MVSEVEFLPELFALVWSTSQFSIHGREICFSFESTPFSLSTSFQSSVTEDKEMKGRGLLDLQSQITINQLHKIEKY